MKIGVVTRRMEIGKYRKDITGLRALAVIAVIINHINKEIMPAGYLGVDIFFVISGYVISSSLYRKRSKNINAYITEFYSRRFRRILPALIAYIVPTTIAIMLLNPSYIVSVRTGMASLIGISNLYLIKTQKDAIYFNRFVKNTVQLK